ncbi:Ohr family peroxiredoxin [uncultured Devosia sp.]|uniref:Ohr family peroxiredoxin n=1 Tax=uncultured Devosia sp. TaxID=211434 RepID=UPI0035CA949D
MSKDLYTARVAVTGGRNGSASSDDGRLAVGLALPEALGGSGEGTNPEQLFAAGFAGCFTSSLKHAASQLKARPDAIAVDAEVVLTLSDDGRYGLRVTLRPGLSGISPDLAGQVITEAERICAYTNSTRGLVGLHIEPV